MNKAVFRRNTCRLCDSKKLEVALQLNATPSGDAYVGLDKLNTNQELYPLDLVLCKDCAHVQLYDVVNPDLLYGNYIYTTSISLGLVEHFKEYANDIIASFKPPKGSLTIDIGSNDGTLLKFFKSHGMKVLGIDPAPTASKNANEAGIETLQRGFTLELARKIRNERGRAMVITANNVFANIDNLQEVIEGIGELLALGGIFVFETGYLLDLVEKRIIDNIYHEHISYYAVKPLKKFFDRYGMELIDVTRTESKGGSFRAVVQSKGGQYGVAPSVSQVVNLETKGGLDKLNIFNDIANEINDKKIKLRNLVCGLKKRGKVIAGYGASVGVTTLIYLFDIASEIDFFIDDNPARHNLFSPGHHIPVFSSDVLYERKPDYVVVLAWRYAEPIIKKHQAFLDSGGQFILLLPKVTIIKG